MAITDYSTTPADNTSVGGASIAEGSTPPGDVNNAIRQIMADIATALTDGTFIGGASYQPLDALLTAIAALTVAADKGLYFTGSDAPATFNLTSAARTLLGKANTADMLSYIGGQAAPAVSGSGTSGSIPLGGGFIMTWRALTLTGSDGSSQSVAYGNNTTYTSWAKAWVEGDDGTSDASIYVTSHGLSSAIVKKQTGNSVPMVIFSIGV
ncbi:hypothetical protein K7W03_14480 [Sphingobium sp. PNB]|uniref:hypothetical protein n=1 Tax=Sphingobium sp. PNB TaxID=863934 RepID=UPI001CA4565E|nr:hypothetical protein [Sphingobium sp. PNB]MCB4860798.1 hypothetical protein [Sphingobium sp. PNB]